jgi:hypothetical protein
VLAYAPQFTVSDLTIMLLCVVGLRLAIFLWQNLQSDQTDKGLRVACEEFVRENPSKVEYDRQNTK